MSLVAYDSSDDSSDGEESCSDFHNTNETAIEVINTEQTNDRLRIPVTQDKVPEIKIDETVCTDVIDSNTSGSSLFGTLPKPKSLIADREDIIEEDDIPVNKEIELAPPKPVKRDRVPVKITVPSLNEFKDLDEPDKTKIIKTSKTGTKLLSLLPKPKGAAVNSTKNLIPTAVNKTAAKVSQKIVQASNNKKLTCTNKETRITTNISMNISYDSNSEDEDDTSVNSCDNTGTDFFALTATESTPDSVVAESCKTDLTLESNNFDSETKEEPKETRKLLVSNVMNLTKEEIFLKNKAEVGPKLPIPEQEYHVDTEGNVAFDEKAIEYLCGRRGVKRKNKEIDETNIIEINGEDIKPDEREWLVKALTEEPVQRPVSMLGGVNSQSKKKHQITYLAHQAKAMEMELKNQWAQNRLTRKQTQSKYGF